MGNISRKLLAALTLLPLLLQAGVLAADSQPEVLFRWAFVMQGPDGELRPLDPSVPFKARPGDLCRILVQPLENACIYLFLHDAQNELQLLFPERFEELDSRDFSGRKYQLEYELDEAKGTEKFYLLASRERLSKLEALTRSYLDLSGKSKSPPDTARAALQRVLEEIARLRQQHSGLVAAAEKPVAIAGGVRGQHRTIDELATEIRAQGFYTKTFRLEH